MIKYWTYTRVIVGSIFINLALWTLPKYTSAIIRLTLQELNKRASEQQREYYRGMN
jgi:hypothetical protein